MAKKVVGEATINEDSACEAIDAINGLLVDYGLSIEFDGKEHDGYEIIQLKEVDGDDDEDEEYDDEDEDEDEEE